MLLARIPKSIYTYLALGVLMLCGCSQSYAEIPVKGIVGYYVCYDKHESYPTLHIELVKAPIILDSGITNFVGSIGTQTAVIQAYSDNNTGDSIEVALLATIVTDYPMVLHGGSIEKNGKVIGISFSTENMNELKKPMTYYKVSKAVWLKYRRKLKNR